MVRLLAWIGVLFVACVGLVAGTRAIARLRNHPPTYLEPGDCTQPCWQGIKPGLITRDAFLEHVQYTPYYGYATDYGDDIANMFELTATESLRLADAIRVYGPPYRVGCFANDLSLYARPHPLTLAISLYFAHGLIEVRATRDDSLPYLSPDMHIRAIRYYSVGEPVYPVGGTTKWRGFAAAPTYLMCYVP